MVLSWSIIMHRRRRQDYLLSHTYITKINQQLASNCWLCS
ncbi:unnamed protein product [Musa banksii]